MIDFREYKDAVRAAVKAADEQDKNWKWKVAAINKDEVTIGWGYLDYLGETGKFTLKAIERQESLEIVGEDPNGLFRAYSFVGDDELFCDVKTIEEGIANAVKNLAREARNRY